jgi:DNA (cytosine-5)-methyltransferase 1
MKRSGTQKTELAAVPKVVSNYASLPDASRSDFWAAECRKSKWPQQLQSAPEVRLVDLFSGCGGLTLGAFIACTNMGRRLTVALAGDNWKDALAIYEANFGPFLRASTSDDLSLIVENLGSTTLSKLGRKLAREAGVVDVVVAGPPCQGHSDLNNSSRRDDPRNLLYTIPVAFALHKKAKFLIIENVPTVVHATGQVVSSALLTLIERGYSVVEFLANAQDFGLPQTRKRHILVASKVHSQLQLSELFINFERRHSDVAVWDFINDLEDEEEIAGDLLTKRSKISPENQSRISYLFARRVYDLPDELRPPCHREKAHSYVSMYGRLNAALPAQTITSGFGSMGQGRFVHPTRPRMITSHEAARIQGFPDYFKFSPCSKLTSMRQTIGNAVPPPIAATLISLLFRPVNKKRAKDLEVA